MGRSAHDPRCAGTIEAGRAWQAEHNIPHSLYWHTRDYLEAHGLVEAHT